MLVVGVVTEGFGMPASLNVPAPVQEYFKGSVPVATVVRFKVELLQTGLLLVVLDMEGAVHPVGVKR